MSSTSSRKQSMHSRHPTLKWKSYFGALVHPQTPFQVNRFHRMGSFIHGGSCNYNGWEDVSDDYSTAYQTTQQSVIV